jgi:hypothetical protein
VNDGDADNIIGVKNYNLSDNVSNCMTDCKMASVSDFVLDVEKETERYEKIDFKINC